jgi:hypothetical protein
MVDLVAVLPRLLPRAVAWAEARSAEVEATGTSLNDSGLSIARTVGVVRPERIRVGMVDRLPIPDDPELRAVSREAGLLGPGMVGLTLGYAIFIVNGYGTNRLFSHECRHVYQYESAGSIAAFLPLYLGQVAAHGYHDAPFEADARAHEVDVV